jgi:hypothetical protein
VAFAVIGVFALGICVMQDQTKPPARPAG